MVVLATDAPFDQRQLRRLCRRVAFALARTGSTGHGGSGDFVIAFSNSRRVADRPDKLLASGPIYFEQPVMSLFALAVVEAVEEAIYNSLLMAETMVGRDGNKRVALPAAEVVRLCRAYDRSGDAPL